MGCYNYIITVLHREVEAKQLPDPMVLQDRGEALVEGELEDVMIRPDGKTAAPEVWAPVAYGVYKADELALVGGEGTVSRRDGPTEEGNGVLVLEQHRAKPVRRGVAFNDEWPREVRECKNRGRGDRRLEHPERCRCVVIPGEALLQKCRQWGSDGVVVVDELAVVPREAQESADRTRGAGLGPVGHHLHLGGIHSDTFVGDDVAEVGDGGDPKSALGALDEELVLLQHGEHGAQVAEVVGLGGAIDQNIIKKHKHEPAKEWTQHVVHERLERCRGVAQPKRHHHELVEAIVGAERRLVDVGRPHADLVVARAKVELNE